jgi:hypothetical protein
MNHNVLISSKKRISAGNVFYLFICFLLLSGCSKFQYVFIDSHLQQNEKKEFITENDTVMIKYSFAGKDFPITLTIFNKLNQPLYIDWDRSVVVINNLQVNGPFFQENQAKYISPLSSVIVTSNQLRSEFIKVEHTDPGIKFSFAEGGPSGIKYSYDEKTTPLFFRNILALTTNEDYSIPTFFDYSFWVSDIIQTGAGPKAMTYYPLNRFFIRKTTVAGNIMGWTALISITILAAAIGGPSE